MEFCPLYLIIWLPTQDTVVRVRGDKLKPLTAELTSPVTITEFVPTQDMLREFLSDRAMPVVCLNGSMGMGQLLVWTGCSQQPWTQSAIAQFGC